MQPKSVNMEKQDIVAPTEICLEPSIVDPSGDSDGQIQYPHGLKLITLTIALMLSTLMVALDTNVIGTAIPRITTQFNSLHDIGWYGSGYLLTLMALQPFYGRVYAYFNIKWVFLTTLLVFEIGSIVCATAPSSKVFIAGRAISGSGAAGIMSGALTIGNFIVSIEKRTVYMSIVMTVYGIASVVGPTLGGVLTDSLSWRWCFWINIPIGAVAVVIHGVLLDSYRTPKSRALSLRLRLAQMDFIGSTMSLAVGLCLLLALNWGGIEYSWSSPRVLVCLICFGVILFLFVLDQRRSKDLATIPPRIFTQRTVFFSCLYICFINIAIDTHIYYLPIYFQAVEGVSAKSSGVHLIPYLATMIGAAIFSAACVSVFKFYVPFMVAGAAILTAGSALIHTLGTNSTSAQRIGYELLSGVGFGLGFQLPYSAMPVVLDLNDLPIGNSLLVFFQALGGAVSVSTAQNIFNHELLDSLQASPNLEDPHGIVAAGATGISKIVGPELAIYVVDAYSPALSRTFLLPVAAAAMAFCWSLGMEWKRVPTSKER